LKEDKDFRKIRKTKGDNAKSDFILREAELIINNYIRDNNVKFISPEIEKKKRKSRSAKDLAINFVLIGGVIALAFLIFRLF
jgi:hypothetical protein